MTQLYPSLCPEGFAHIPSSPVDLFYSTDIVKLYMQYNNNYCIRLLLFNKGFAAVFCDTFSYGVGEIKSEVYKGPLICGES